MNEKAILLNLSEKQKRRVKHAFKDLLYYLGECEHKTEAFFNHELLGQNWLTMDNLDYIPTQVVDNKVKPLINKQARFMLSKKPDLLFNAYNKDDKEIAEELRQYIDDILESTQFWSNAMKAFRLATITKKVMLRLEANPEQPIKLVWHGLNDFSYDLDPNNNNRLVKAVIVAQDSATAYLTYDKRLWFKYIYELRTNDNNESTCFLITEIYSSSNLSTPQSKVEQDTKLTQIPCWVIHNEKDLSNPHGQSDIRDIKPLQDQYNRKLSDFSDALRFNMFGQDVFIDATPKSVNSSKIAPNAVLALESIDDKQASYNKVENTFSNVDPVKFFLQLLDDSMHEKLAIPKPDEIKKVISGKALGFVYAELIARCDEKWIDWEPVIKEMISLIRESCIKFNCYDTWDSKWDNLLYHIMIEKNYPIPEDEEDKKKLGMEEVAANVRSHESYIKDFSNEEDSAEEFKKICENLSAITAAQNEMFNAAGDPPNNGE
jgi:hypothetical protein